MREQWISIYTVYRAAHGCCSVARYILFGLVRLEIGVREREQSQSSGNSFMSSRMIAVHPGIASGQIHAASVSRDGGHLRWCPPGFVFVTIGPCVNLICEGSTLNDTLSSPLICFLGLLVSIAIGSRPGVWRPAGDLELCDSSGLHLYHAPIFNDIAPKIQQQCQS